MILKIGPVHPNKDLVGIPLLIIFAIFHTDFVKNLDFLQTMLNGPKELLIRMEAYLSHHGTLEGKLNNFCIVR